ncbi:hypothetical protein [Teredinibacter franksiae]|uniref:hypothetical protein n=1 Tax=Teredinibacter franksiae TaxID=2761453 RepID=UPI001C8972F8|nr:hypothetical protein [Teredinibacter franksiae]
MDLLGLHLLCGQIMKKAGKARWGLEFQLKEVLVRTSSVSRYSCHPVEWGVPMSLALFRGNAELNRKVLFSTGCIFISVWRFDGVYKFGVLQ